MDLITVDEFVFNGTPHQLQAVLDKFRYQNYGNFYALKNADDSDLAPDAAGYSVSLRSAKNGEGLWLHAVLVGGQSKIAVLADEAAWPLHKQSWETLRAYIDEHMAGVDELAQPPTVTPTGRQGNYSKEDWKNRFELINQAGMKPDFDVLSNETGRKPGYIRKKWEQFGRGEL